MKSLTINLQYEVLFFPCILCSLLKFFSRLACWDRFYYILACWRLRQSAFFSLTCSFSDGICNGKKIIQTQFWFPAIVLQSNKYFINSPMSPWSMVIDLKQLSGVGNYRLVFYLVKILNLSKGFLLGRHCTLCRPCWRFRRDGASVGALFRRDGASVGALFRRDGASVGSLFRKDGASVGALFRRDGASVGSGCCSLWKRTPAIEFRVRCRFRLQFEFQFVTQ